jgi:hypothetical protein
MLAGTFRWEEPPEGKEVYTGESWEMREGKEYRVVFGCVLIAAGARSAESW